MAVISTLGVLFLPASDQVSAALVQNNYNLEKGGGSRSVSQCGKNYFIVENKRGLQITQWDKDRRETVIMIEISRATLMNNTDFAPDTSAKFRSVCNDDSSLLMVVTMAKDPNQRIQPQLLSVNLAANSSQLLKTWPVEDGSNNKSPIHINGFFIWVHCACSSGEDGLRIVDATDLNNITATGGRNLPEGSGRHALGNAAEVKAFARPDGSILVGIASYRLGMLLYELNEETGNLEFKSVGWRGGPPMTSSTNTPNSEGIALMSMTKDDGTLVVQAFVTLGRQSNNTASMEVIDVTNASDPSHVASYPLPRKAHPRSIFQVSFMNAELMLVFSEYDETASNGKHIKTIYLINATNPSAITYEHDTQRHVSSSSSYATAASIGDPDTCDIVVCWPDTLEVLSLCPTATTTITTTTPKRTTIASMTSTGSTTTAVATTSTEHAGVSMGIGSATTSAWPTIDEIVGKTSNATQSTTEATEASSVETTRSASTTTKTESSATPGADAWAKLASAAGLIALGATM